MAAILLIVEVQEADDEPMDRTAVAVPRTSIMRGCQGGSTSSITMLARPVRCTSRVFFVWLICSPPTSMASQEAL